MLDSYGIRVVVSVYGAAADAPRTRRTPAPHTARFVADLLRDNPEIDDVAIWNDPNDGTFWAPQFAPGGASLAPADYEALLAQCYDQAHAVRKIANVISRRRLEELADTPGAFTLAWHPPAAWFTKLVGRLQGEQADEADLRHARLHPAPGQLGGAPVDEAPRRLGDLARRLRRR